jgi:hypothetical protein
MGTPNMQHSYESLDTVFAVTDILIERGVASQLITAGEASTMQAISGLLIVQDHFHPNDIVNLTKVNPGNARQMVCNLATHYELLTGYLDLDESCLSGSSKRGRHQRYYTPTEFGHQVFRLFQPEEPVT